MRFDKKSIRFKLLFYILPLLFLSLGVIAMVSYHFSQQYLTKSVDETAFAIGSNYANKVQAIEGELLARLQEISSTRQFRSGTDKEYIIASMNEAFKRIGKFDVITFISLDGMGTRADGSTVELSQRAHFKDAVRTQQTLISDTVVASSTGKLSIQVVTDRKSVV
jgi:methyl-accepting chemotaxis protein